MIGGNIVNILAKTLHSDSTTNSTLQLNNLREQQGFTIELLVISDDSNYDISIRQAALIYLKNTIQDHCKHNPIITPADLSSLKASLLLALIRNINNQKLAPTYREIIFQLADKYYPKEWPEIVTEALSFIQRGTDFSQLQGSIQALKAVFSVFGKSISKEIELSNLSNKAIIPILNLISKLFQNFNEDTSIILISIFKLITTAIQFNIPPILLKNIHSLMIFIKKILDLKVPISGPENYSFFLLKKLSLRILFKMYQKHANFKFTTNKQFATHFHSRYTKSFVQTLVLQMLETNDNEKQAKSRQMELIKFSLSCLAYINHQNSEAAQLLQMHRNSLVNLCLHRFKINLNKQYKNFIDFRLYVQENRVHMKEFFFSILRCEALPERQQENMSNLLTLLLQCIKNGDNELKELALYLFSEMSTQIKTFKISIEEKIGFMIATEIKNLLSPDHHIIVRARACNLIASYNDIDLPEQHLAEISLLVYNCLLVGDSEKETFLKVYACNAFNSLMKYSSIYEHIKPHLKDILKIYTSLLQVDVSIIKNFEDLLDLLQEEIAPFANDLVSLLITHFHLYSSKQDSTDSTDYNNNLYNQQNNLDENQEEEEQEYEQNNNQSIAKAMISSIRQILQCESTDISSSNKEEMFNIVIKIFSDPSQLYIEEGFNILNLLLYKLKENVNPKYYIFLKVIIYAILGVPVEYINNLKHGSNFDKSFGQILANICIDPDSDIIENSVGSLRNFIAKSDYNALRAEKDHFGISFVQYLFKMVKLVHQNGDKKHSQTDRLIILTLYTTLVQYKMLSEEELSVLLNDVVGWMQMQVQAVEGGGMSFGSLLKYTYTPVYLQIIMLSIYSYGKAACSKFNINVILHKVLQLKESFRCDYELSRVIIGIASILKLHQVSDTATITDLMNALPAFVFNLCKLRQEGDKPQNDIEMDDEAEEQQFFGDDDNSMMVGRNRMNPTSNDLLLSKQAREEDEQSDDDDWQKQFNKYYESTLDKVDEIKILQMVLKEQGGQYCNFMEVARQQELSLYLSNAPPKQA